MLEMILPYVRLPDEITGFERAYLARVHRIALVFLYAHLPGLMLVAAICRTGVLRAAALSLFALVGPALAHRSFASPRHISRAFGFTAMCLGGLLVHFGQGAMQIEMHFYFFVLLALLAIFADPAVILLAAATVGLHHLLLYFLLPRSLFNYEASLWAVLVHALFLAFESVAACFVARSFFDNVIGLERIVERRTRELADRTQELCLLLDNVGQGFVSLGLDGRPRRGRSAILATWLGSAAEGETLAAYLGRTDPVAAARFELGWESIVEDVLPLELALDQMPRRMTAGARVLELAYRPILRDAKLDQVLLVISDVSVVVERERCEAEQRELLAVFERILADRAGFLEFLDEAGALVRALVDGGSSPRDEVQRRLHTLKGTAAMFSVSHLAALCHDLEGRMGASGGDLTATDRAELGELWASTSIRLARLAAERASSSLEITDAEYRDFVCALASGAPREGLLRALEGWKLEAAETRLQRLAEYARELARRLGKGSIEVEIASSGLRLSARRWAPLWGALTHLVQNAVDHGLEPAAERALAGKALRGCIALRAAARDQHVILEISDDGRGVDIEEVQRRARDRGLPHATRGEILSAVFAGGLTTRDTATPLSGRGVGMSAVRAACEALGGTIAVHTEPGQGTRVELRMPIHEALTGIPPSSWSPAPVLDLL